MDRTEEEIFILDLLKKVVNYPDEVKIDRIVDERGILLSVSLNPSDVGLVIGQKGQTAHAIRTLLRIIAGKQKSSIGFKILVPDGQDS